MVSPLQKAEEAVKKVEDFYSRDDPMTEIDKVRGVEHAYYDEKAMKEAEEALAEAEKGEEYSCIECTNHYDGKGHYDDVGEGPFCDRCFELLTGTTGPKGEEEGSDSGTIEQCPKCGSAFIIQSDVGDLRCGSCGWRKKMEEEEAPLDASAVKQSLNDALEEASNLMSGIEGFMTDIEELDMDDIDETVEVVNNILQALKDAKQMGFPSPTDSPKPQTKKPTPTPPDLEKEPEPKEKEPEKGEA